MLTWWASITCDPEARWAGIATSLQPPLSAADFYLVQLKFGDDSTLRAGKAVTCPIYNENREFVSLLEPDDFGQNDVY